MTQVVFLLPPGTVLLDVAGPARVFTSATQVGFRYDQHFIAETTVVRSAEGLPLQTSQVPPSLRSGDLIFIPGWAGPLEHEQMVFSASLQQWLRDQHQSGVTLASVCSGSFALAQMGLLNGRRCTTHHDLQDKLAQLYPAAHVVRDVLFTEDTGVTTSAGLASGIDLALDIVATRHGPGTAARVARDMVVYARRNGESPQLSALLRYRSHLDDMVHRVQDRIDAHFSTALPLGSLAKLANTSPRTLTRIFRAATGLTPLQYQQELRRERAGHLVSHGKTFESAAREVGFTDARMLRRLRARARE